MRDGVLEGMQHFDLVIEKMIRDGAIEIDTGLAYATNQGNMRLNMSDLLEGEAAQAEPASSSGTELKIERL
jgi:twitching motility protein PilT